MLQSNDHLEFVETLFEVWVRNQPPPTTSIPKMKKMNHPALPDRLGDVFAGGSGLFSLRPGPALFSVLDKSPSQG
jgi:hypothetical protein